MFLGTQFSQRIQDSRVMVGLNPAVRAFVVSEALFWAAWNFVAPIFSIFVVSEIPGASVSHAAYAFTLYLLSRMLTELVVSRKAGRLSNPQRAVIDIVGMVIVSIAYIAIAISPTLPVLFGYYAIAGFGFGVSSPVKLSFFSRSMEKETEASVWGIYDVVILSAMAIATTAGGIIVDHYGFKELFLLASVVNIIGVIPYLFFIRHWRTQKLSHLS